ncbi:putative WRKY transcription factor 75 [Canna indica]|uniref:WRKY transcription factor 75 n=1 Tax=Canna indica TaxID=4628 RepID=A0AAQ3KSZ9_9LILI|nr:putative WRKY transcription factor 75 [Canna indica]
MDILGHVRDRGTSRISTLHLLAVYVSLLSSISTNLDRDPSIGPIHHHHSSLPYLFPPAAAPPSPFFNLHSLSLQKENMNNMENYASLLRYQQPSSSSSSSHLSFLPSDVVSSNGVALVQAAAAAAAEDQLGAEVLAHRMGSSAASSPPDAEKKKEKKARKHRYAFHTKSQVDILDDGYRWRKYGQKAVKNNNFPSYYRCTHEGCNVKKQVQRLAKDEGVVVTTYEGVHNHPIERPNDNFEHILKQMQINYSHFN